MNGMKLELRNEGIDGYRHYLEGRDVHCGDTLEMRLGSGTWLKGRYEWSAREGDRPGFYIDDEHVLLIRAHDLLRWPSR